MGAGAGFGAGAGAADAIGEAAGARVGLAAAEAGKPNPSTSCGVKPKVPPAAKLGSVLLAARSASIEAISRSEYALASRSARRRFISAWCRATYSSSSARTPATSSSSTSQLTGSSIPAANRFSRSVSPAKPLYLKLGNDRRLGPRTLGGIVSSRNRRNVAGVIIRFAASLCWTINASNCRSSDITFLLLFEPLGVAIGLPRSAGCVSALGTGGFLV